MHMMWELAPSTEGLLSTWRTAASRRSRCLRVAPQLVEVASQPTRAFNGYQVHNLKTGAGKLLPEFVGAMKESVGEVARIAGGIAVLTFFQIARQDRREPGLVEESTR
jgi:hypothetical protein